MMLLAGCPTKNGEYRPTGVKPGVLQPMPSDLVLSCGDDVCDAVHGENIENCPDDCKPAAIKAYNRQTICKDVKRAFLPWSACHAEGLLRELVSRSECPV